MLSILTLYVHSCIFDIVNRQRVDILYSRMLIGFHPNRHLSQHRIQHYSQHHSQQQLFRMSTRCWFMISNVNIVNQHQKSSLKNLSKLYPVKNKQLIWTSYFDSVFVFVNRQCFDILHSRVSNCFSSQSTSYSQYHRWTSYW